MRLRITFSKNGALRYTGHLDLQTTWERTVRRAGLPLAYTHGFHPGPRIQIASALPLGFIGRAEIVDIWLEEVGADTSSLCGGRQVRPYVDIIQSAAPPGLTILSVEQVAEAGPALQTQVTSAEYEVTLLDPVDGRELEKNIAATLAAESLPRERRGKTYNLRPLIGALSILPPAFPASSPSNTASLQAASPPPSSSADAALPGVPRLFMRLAARAGATARPEEVLDVLGVSSDTTRIERTRLILTGGTG
jgi:radical SAM-linked protein